MNRKPITFQLPADVEARLLEYARGARRGPWEILVEALGEFLADDLPSPVYLVLHGLWIPLRVNRSTVTERLPDRLLCGAHEITADVYRRLREEHGARIEAEDEEIRLLVQELERLGGSE